jgi:hypothetical protein
VLARDALLAPHPPRQLLTPAQLLELGLPAHIGDPFRSWTLPPAG